MQMFQTSLLHDGVVVVGDAAFVVPVVNKAVEAPGDTAVVYGDGELIVVVCVVGDTTVVAITGIVVTPQLGQDVYRAKSA